MNAPKGAAELMIDVRDSYAEPLTEDKLFAWQPHADERQPAELPLVSGVSHAEPMQVVFRWL